MNTNNGNNVSIKSNTEKKVLIKDYFKNEVETIRLVLYARMHDEKNRASALRAYDGLEALALRSINDKDALNRFIMVLREVDKVKTVSLSIDEEKIQKVLK